MKQTLGGAGEAAGAILTLIQAPSQPGDGVSEELEAVREHRVVPGRNRLRPPQGKPDRPGFKSCLTICCMISGHIFLSEKASEK